MLNWWYRLTDGVKAIVAIVLAAGVAIAIPLLGMLLAMAVAVIFAYMVFQSIREDQREQRDQNQ